MDSSIKSEEDGEKGKLTISGSCLNYQTAISGGLPGSHAARPDSLSSTSCCGKFPSSGLWKGKFFLLFSAHLWVVAMQSSSKQGQERNDSGSC